MVGDRPDSTPITDKHSGSFLSDDVLKPLYNEAIASPLNALRTLANPVAHAVTGQDLARAPQLAERDESSWSPGWFVQKATSGVGSLLPYLVAARVSGATMRGLGSAAGLEGTAARLATSERFALVSGAGAYDFLRSDDPNGTSLRQRIGNAAGGASAFYLFGVGNAFTADSGLGAKLAVRAATGALGADSQVLLSAGIGRGELASNKDLTDAAVSGAAMNVIMPEANDRIRSGVDRFNIWRGKGIAADRYIQQNDLSGRTDGLDEALAKVPFARVLDNGKPPVGKNTIEFDPSRQMELAGSRAVSEGKDPAAVQADMKDASAEHLRTQLLNKGLELSGRTAAGTMTNDQIVQAMKDGRIVIEPAPQPRDLYENGVDMGMGTRFMKLPVGEHIDFQDANTAKQTLQRWASEGREMEYLDGITLAPGETTLGFTDKSITLPRVPQRQADGTMQDWKGGPVTGDLGQKSSLARNFLTNNETASALNNNSTAHKVVFEITNHSPNVVTLRPGMPFGSIRFEELGSFPAETERYKMGSVKGQTSLAGNDGVNSSLGYKPVEQVTAPTPAASFGARLSNSLSLFDNYNNFNGPAIESPVKAAPTLNIDYEAMPLWEQLRYRPDLQQEYAAALKMKLDPTNSVSDSDIIKSTAPNLVAQTGG